PETAFFFPQSKIQNLKSKISFLEVGQDAEAQQLLLLFDGQPGDVGHRALPEPAALLVHPDAFVEAELLEGTERAFHDEVLLGLLLELRLVAASARLDADEEEDRLDPRLAPEAGLQPGLEPFPPGLQRGVVRLEVALEGIVRHEIQWSASERRAWCWACIRRMTRLLSVRAGAPLGWP